MSPRIPYRTRISLAPDLERLVRIQIASFFHLSFSYISGIFRIDPLHQPGDAIARSTDEHEDCPIRLVHDEALQLERVRQGLDRPPEAHPLYLTMVRDSQLLHSTR